jgi:hypothetical protein
MARLTIQVNYDTIDAVYVDDMTNPTEFKKFIDFIKEKAPTWEATLIKKAEEIQHQEQTKKIERENIEALVQLRKGICRLALPYDKSTNAPRKCPEEYHGHLIMHPKKGFCCNVHNYSTPRCMRVTPTGRISLNRKHYKLDRFKLAFFKKAIMDEIKKVKDSYESISEQASKKLVNPNSTTLPPVFVKNPPEIVPATKLTFNNIVPTPAQPITQQMGNATQVLNSIFKMAQELNDKSN